LLVNISFFFSPTNRNVIDVFLKASHRTLNSDTLIQYTPSDTVSVREIFKEKAKAHRKALSSHPNSLMRPLTTQPPTRRLRRKWTFHGIK